VETGKIGGYKGGQNMTRGIIPDQQKEVERRRKISEAKKGKNHPLFGKHPSEETRRKMSEALKGEKNPLFGKHPSEETRRKMSEAQKGKHPSIETRRKQSEAKKGENHPMFGKHLSEETRRKMSEARKGKPVSEETRRKMSEARKGKHLSEETRQKRNMARTSLSEEILRERQEAAKQRKQQQFNRKLAKVLFGKETVGKYPLQAGSQRENEVVAYKPRTKISAT